MLAVLSSLDLNAIDPGTWAILLLVALALGVSPRALAPAILRAWAARLGGDGAGTDPRGGVGSDLLDAFQARMELAVELKLDQKLDQKLDEKLDAKLAPIIVEQGLIAASQRAQSAEIGRLRNDLSYLRGRVDGRPPDAADVPQPRTGS